MHGLFEPNVFRAGNKASLDDAAIGFEPQSQPDWIGLATDEAGVGMRQHFH